MNFRSNSKPSNTVITADIRLATEVLFLVTVFSWFFFKLHTSSCKAKYSKETYYHWDTSITLALTHTTVLFDVLSSLLYISLLSHKRPDRPSNVPCQPNNNPGSAETRLFQFSVGCHWGSTVRERRVAQLHLNNTHTRKLSKGKPECINREVSP